MNEIVIDQTDGFVYLSFSVLTSTVAESGEAFIVIGGSVDSRQLQIAIRIVAGILPNDFSDDGPATVSAAFDGIGFTLNADSTQSLAEIYIAGYGLARTPISVPISLTFTAVALAGDPARVASEPIKFKLFHETGSTDDEEGPCYFEMFLDIDLPGKQVRFGEKDFDFREGVLNALQTTS